MFERIKKFFKDIDKIERENVLEMVEKEEEELENIFAVIIFGMFIGYPSPPIQITLDMLPLMEDELNLMLDKVSIAHDPLGELFSILDID
ncbi:MAG: hypothetical protein U9O65_01780 [Thermotogota bacterium]|nr:hypothetical protein [Thermotogota bacterium]